jgi:hypothetical protein
MRGGIHPLELFEVAGDIQYNVYFAEALHEWSDMYDAVTIGR